MFIIEMSCKFTNHLLFPPQTSVLCGKTNHRMLKSNQITCLYGYKESENMHACHVHEIEFCIAWFVYVFSVFPVSIFLLFCSDHWTSKTFRLWMLYRTSFTVSIKFGVVQIIIVFVQMMITGNIIIIVQRMRKFMKWRCGQSDVLCVLVAGNATIACRLKGLNIWLLLIHQQYYNRYLFV